MTKEVDMVRLRHELLGIGQGNFHINNIGTINVAAVLEVWKKNKRVNTVVALRCDFTNTIVSEDSEIEKAIHGVNWFFRTKDKADGVIFGTTYNAAVIFNADCPIVAVYDSSNGKNRLAVLHAGFRCLVPEKRRGVRARGIIQALFEDHGLNPKTVNVFFGYGIGPCCYGVEHSKRGFKDYPELNDPTDDLPISRATRGPRAGQRSIDLYQIILNQLAAVGVPDKHISADMACASCAGIAMPTYYSNCRLGSDYGRNAALVWMEA